MPAVANQGNSYLAYFGSLLNLGGKWKRLWWKALVWHETSCLRLIWHSFKPMKERACECCGCLNLILHHIVDWLKKKHIGGLFFLGFFLWFGNVSSLNCRAGAVPCKVMVGKQTWLSICLLYFSHFYPKQCRFFICFCSYSRISRTVQLCGKYICAHPCLKQKSRAAANTVSVCSECVCVFLYP